jgi:Ribbon-helix-helix protein, copG family.
MEPIPIRIREDTKEVLESEAADQNISVSAYSRELIEKGREFDAQEHEDVLQEYTVPSESGQEVSQLRAMTLRVEPSTEETLAEETADTEESLSEYVRGLIARGRAQEDIVANDEEPEQSDVPESTQTADEDDLWAESEHQNDQSKMGERSVELTLSPETHTWLQEQTADSDLSVAAYVEELVSTARNTESEGVGANQTAAQEAPDNTLSDRVGTLEAEFAAVNERQTDTVQEISELKQRIATLEARIE